MEKQGNATQENVSKEKENPQLKTIFGNVDPKRTDPLTMLIDELLGNFSQEEQISKISKTLIRRETWDESDEDIGCKCIDALEKLFGFTRAEEFKKKLMEIYSELPREERIDSFEKRYAETAVKIKLYILGKIICGWNVRFNPVCEQISDIYGKVIKIPYFIEGSEECFSYLINAYDRARLTSCDISSDRPYEKVKPGIVRKGIEGLFRKQLENCNWPAYILNQWIIREDVPKEIATVLLKARTRIGDLEIGLKELRFLEQFNLFVRSEKAIDIVKKYIQKIRLIEELTSQLCSQINSIAIVNKVDYDLQSEEMAWLKVIFRLSPMTGKNRPLYPQIVTNIIGMRDKLLEGLENPPKIMIKAEGLDFNFKEQ